VEKFINRFVMRFPKNLFASFSLSVASTASACPDCALKNSGGVIEPQTVTAKMALSDNTLFMILMVVGVIGFMVWMMVKTCRELTAQRSLQTGVSRS
jgi:heme/copper-type cytochrome/quinol oxidase subunit 2